MRHGMTNRRQRNRGNGGRRNGGHGGGGNNRSQVFDSNGPEVRIRGTAYQVAEKYLVLAKDAAAAGDRILAESYLQHAEHYQRVINSWGDVQGEGAGQRQQYSPNSEVAGNNDDLALPASILGGSSQPENKENAQLRTSEMSTT